MYNYKNLAEEEINKSIVSFCKSKLSSAITHLELAEFYLKQQLSIFYNTYLEECLSNVYSKLTYYNFLMAQKTLEQEDFKSAFIYFNKAKKYCLNNNFKFNNQKFNTKKETTEYNEKCVEKYIYFCLEKLKNLAEHNSNIAVWLSEQYEFGDYIEKNIKDSMCYYGLATSIKNPNTTEEHLKYLEKCDEEEFNQLLILAKKIAKNREKMNKSRSIDNKTIKILKNRENLNKTEILNKKSFNLKENRNSVQIMRKSIKLWDDNNATLPEIIIKHY